VIEIKEQKDAWYLDPIMVLILLFLVLGPFAFPLLFRSNGFSRPAKLILAAIVIAYTLYLIYISFKLGLSWESKF
jgi:Ca2+/H+ antiporter